jgi:MFS transporter, ACS family, glucarate transporter
MVDVAPPAIAIAPSRAAGAGATRVRYLVLGTIFLVTTLNYADRATLSVTGPAMRAEFGFSAVQMGYLFSAFSWAYVLAQVPGGWLLDRFGPRRVYAASIFAWSTFTLLQAGSGWGAQLASGLTAVTTLFMLRFAVGLAEAPAFPANAKVVASWFPSAERGTASAIFNSAQYFAAVAFTPLMAAITHWFGWHAVYVSMGLVGMVFALVWVRSMRSPVRHPWVNQAELQHIADGGGLIDMGEAPRAGALASRTMKEGRTAFYLKRLLTNRMLLGVYVGQFSINVLTYFFLTWFPVYLVQQRHMSILKAGFMASLPALCGFVGGVLGGLLSDALLKAGWSLTAARKLPIIGGMLLSVSLILCNYVDSEWLVVGLMALAFFGKGVGSLGWAVVADTAPREVVGLAGSIFNMFGNTAGIVTPIVIGYIVDTTGSFNLALVFVGLNALVTVIAYTVVVGKIRRIEFPDVPA